MDSGHRGSRRPDRDRMAGRRSHVPDNDEPLHARSDWDPGSPDLSRPEPEPTQDSAEWLPFSESDSPGPSDFDVRGYRQRLLSGPGAELYGMGGGGTMEHSRGSMPFDRGQEGAPDGGPHSHEFAAPQTSGQDLGAPDESPEESSGLVRPYFRTRGRTKPDYDLALEALVSTSERGRRLERVRVPEHRSICGLCLDTRSVAEVAALLHLPLGVVRVLVGDVAGLGLVLVHSASAMEGGRPSIEFMERVLSGLRRI